MGVGAIALSGLGFSGCSDEEDAMMTPEIPACLPAFVKGELWLEDDTKFTYDESGTLESITYQDSDDEFLQSITYDDQNRLILAGKKDDNDYFEFEYSDSEIKEKYYYRGGEGSHSLVRYYLYQVDAQGRITSRSEYDVEEEESGTKKRYTEQFFYDENGNITRVEGTSEKNSNEKDVTVITYDNKTNPYHTIGFVFGELEGAFNFLSLSKNNPVSIQWYEGDLVDQLTYEYDELGNPTKTTYQDYDTDQDYDSEGNPIGEPKETIKMYESSTTFSCQ